MICTLNIFGGIKCDLQYIAPFMVIFWQLIWIIAIINNGLINNIANIDHDMHLRYITKRFWNSGLYGSNVATELTDKSWRISNIARLQFAAFALGSEFLYESIFAEYFLDVQRNHKTRGLWYR